MAAPKLRTVGDILTDMDADKAAGIGHNGPPAPTPYEAAQRAVDDIAGEARLWLDGAACDSQDMADGLAKLLDEARKASKLADEARKAEAKPFDDGKAAVQARYKPLLATAERVADTLKLTLGKWLTAEAARKAEAVRAAQAAADRQAEIARKAREAADPTNLAQVETAEAALAASEAAQRAADRAENDTAKAKGGARAVSLRTVWSATVTDRRAALNHYAVRNQDGLTAWVQEQADRDARGSRGTVPGVEFTSSQVAV